LPSVDDADGYEIPSLYGPPLVLVQESCAGFADTHMAALSLLFSLAVYACAIETSSCETFWNTLLVKQDDSSDDEGATRLSATMCAEFLSVLAEDSKRPVTPSNERRRRDFEAISRPLVRHRLLQGLKASLEEESSASVVPGISNSDPYMCSLLVSYEIPQICLTLWRDPALIDVSYELIKLMVDEYHDDVLALFVQSKSAILSLFDMLTFNSTVDYEGVNVEDFRRLVASILGSLAQDGMLTESVDRLEVRSSAIAALAAACLAEDEVPVDEDGDAPATSSRMSSRCMQCLVELCTVETEEALHHRKMTLSQSEAEAITRSLGKKICQMVTARFLERAKLQQYDVSSDDDIMEAPDVAMLCAVAQHDSSLKILRSIGGLHALCLIASEGELSAINALHQASIEDPSLILDVDGHKSLMALFSEESKASRNHSPELNREIETESFRVLAQLCRRSKGRNLVTKANNFDECMSYAMETESSMMETASENVEPTETGDEASNDEAKTGDDAPGDESGAGDGISQADAETGGEALEEDEELEGTESVDANSSAPEPVAITSAATPPATIRTQEDVSLEIAAFKFLSSLVPSEKCRPTLLEASGFIHASLALAKCSPSFELKSEAVRFLVTIAPYAKRELGDSMAFSAGDLMEVFRESLHLDTLQTSLTVKVNEVQSSAMEGAERIFDQVSSPFQSSVMAHAVERFTRLVKSVTRPSKSDARDNNGGPLACCLTLLMLRAVGNKDVQCLFFTSDLMTSMIQVTQWRYDPKLRSEEQDRLQWDAAVCHCLQIIAFVFRGTEESLKQASVVPPALSRTVLMISRPGKAPRKAIDFKTALRRIIDEGTNATGVVAAQRILNSLED